MLFRQYPDREPVVAVSYLLGCPKKGIGAVVDPVGDVGRYLKESEAGNLSIRYVIDTHMHADHVSSGRELARPDSLLGNIAEPSPCDAQSANTW